MATLVSMVSSVLCEVVSGVDDGIVVSEEELVFVDWVVSFEVGDVSSVVVTSSEVSDVSSLDEAVVVESGLLFLNPMTQCAIGIWF